ncbi:PAS domain S-box-containing protein/diguanylate cyclase (GGDEF) domain-containing protein [Modicisalibacter ilicicola DSM 19980]|uniref:PAS domain S-box-containing protein/diguanylate cyclase (GGDEF) domain-containing protein n=1 Tax=Modicisalibacter ilicicola DSM 19980 TaxID=1121942 RepID=A0A1M4YY73_9GAMM|nr:EAL domain-containing protein [Halomonas ilicicola]SHF10751.1 PAS domain S-box-containing protein/diguanylate cyclase (GGDEF) domain-containing protein [Halomonas ilicicola DSM 19980]
MPHCASCSLSPPGSRIKDSSRLEALDSLRLLDTPFEERFDVLTRLACRLFDVPIALVSLVDDERQWFKSAQGITLRETPVEYAFCAHVVEANATLVVTDASQDPRFRNNPLVLGAPHIRFYAGVPIHGPAGMPLGTFCIIDTRPRGLSEHDKETLHSLARLVTLDIAHGRQPLYLGELPESESAMETTVGALSTRAEQRHRAGAAPRLILLELLDDLLRLARCEYGLVGEVRPMDGTLTLDVLGMSLGEVSHDAQAFFSQGRRRLSLERMNALVDNRLLRPEIQVFSERDFARMPSSALPENHPRLRNALLVPFVVNDRNIGLMLIANRPGGFDQDRAKRLLKPVMHIGSRLLESLHKDQEKSALYATLEEFRATLDATLDLILIFEEESQHFTYCNQGGLDQLGYSDDELKALSPAQLIDGLDSTELTAQFAALRQGRNSIRLNTHLRCRDGDTLPVQATIQRTRYEDCDRYNYVIVARDLRESLEAQREIDWITHHDALTRQLNRTGFLKALGKNRPGRHDASRRQAILLCGVDRFKRINDAHGTAVADDVLRELAGAFSSALAAYPGALLGRLGGDEFAIAVNLTSDKHALELADALRHRVEQHRFPMLDELQLTISIGLATATGGYIKPEELLRRANAAQVQAKRHGRNRVRQYMSGMLQEASRHQSIERRLSGAFARGDFYLHFQPQWQLADLSQPIGAEVLLRWRDEKLGVIGPDVFVPILEENGMMVEVGNWIIEQALDELVAGRDALPEGFFISINVSAIQLMDDDHLATHVMEALRRRGLPTHMLELEITETALIQSPDWIGQQLAALYDLGIRIALDDFGTGFSSLSHLKQFPFDTIKIDKSFIAGLPGSGEDRAIVESLLTLCSGFGREVCAEGIETREQLEFLTRHGCERVQGYYLARPGPELPAPVVSHPKSQGNLD